ncbi:pimelyl-ACP methyl ester esterase [Photobacterium aquae]|uniref:Pimeloyl-[acyl-carrier protein] methyl ester esterase n=1 Tax=Photobacterium aquae TaxID=1195763 RepID=A0A0J1JYU4_9GAMM|nr:pimeloyl-ACP methyl ester esterase BioH [Photobacterium aquae]KLV07412.1 pimelyl-ACP methyl ester esterase [Photobacterium aquae]
MTAKLHWETYGQGSDLVLIHGWGMNGAVWQSMLPVLAEHHKVHVVDLPGYGHSQPFPSQALPEIAKTVLASAPPSAAWLGWSLGGLVATEAALQAPERVSRLVTVASSPCFAASEGWRGIKPEVLVDFRHQLRDDFKGTVERFMALQAMGSPSARRDIKQLKDHVLSRPAPCQDALAGGLNILADEDLRGRVADVKQPWLRVYGRLDGLVPVKVAADTDLLAPLSQSHVLGKASHAPFVSHPDAFLEAVLPFLVTGRAA